eukprot:6056231-Amphidinium_carterae.2
MPILMDQADDAELRHVEGTTIQAWDARYAEVTGAPCEDEEEEEEEPFQEHLIALHQRVVISAHPSSAPCCGAAWSSELPALWQAVWRIFAVVYIMLCISTLALLQLHERGLQRLCRLWPAC